MAKLTKTFVDKVQSPASGYAIHWDDKVPGYGLRITASGVRSFVAQGRVFGKAVIVTIGRYGLYTEDQARGRARSILQQMRDGIDPRAVSKADAAVRVSLQDVLEAYVGRPGKLKASTAAEYRRHVEKSLAKWAGLPIASITRDMVK
ncbi:MAG: Arm DNA-binding domain-containing protein, partial [Sphingomonas sp.]